MLVAKEELDFEIKSPKVRGRIFLRAKLENTSPLAISDGREEYSDADIYRDHTGKPMIPGTSFMGALKAKLEELGLGSDYEKVYKYLFGFAHKSDGRQSHLILDDLKCTSARIRTSIRDGVKIDPESNLAEDQGKYDYEILEPGHQFLLEGEITIRDIEDTNEGIEEILSILAKVLAEGALQVGSQTSFGFGQLKGTLEKSDELTKEDYFKFLESDDQPRRYTPISTDKVKISLEPYMRMEMTLRPTTPFFIGGGEVQNDADDGSLRSDGEYVVSAKSLKGAIRHHAYRIAHTVHDKDIAKYLCNQIFGHRGEGRLTKSKFWTTDAKIEDHDLVKPQTQVGIDRFTGGAMDQRLFSTEPVWPREETRVIINWRLRELKNEDLNNASIGLLLLVARDLMTELLPVGGDKAIGRGRFVGIEASLKVGDTALQLQESEGVLTAEKEHKVALNRYISSFLDFTMQKQAENENNEGKI